MRQPKNLEIGTITTTNLTQLTYSVPQGTVTSPMLVFTNTTSNLVGVSVYISDSSGDYLFASDILPSGVGKTWRVSAMHDLKLNYGQNIKVQVDASTGVNYFLSGSEVS